MPVGRLKANPPRRKAMLFSPKTHRPYPTERLSCACQIFSSYCWKRKSRRTFLRLSCITLSWLNQLFGSAGSLWLVQRYRAAALPTKYSLPPSFMASALPTTKYKVPLLGHFSSNAGPFNRKEHVLITIFANAGGQLLLRVTPQVLGYGCAGLLRKHVVEPAHMWWPSILFEFSVFGWKFMPGIIHRLNWCLHATVREGQ